MKNLNWIIMGRMTLEEMTIFLQWLDAHPSGEVTSREMLDFPIKSHRLSGVVLGLLQLEYINRPKNVVTINDSGRRFITAEIRERKALLKAKFLDVVPVKRLSDLLERSFSGRLNGRVVLEHFREFYGGQVTEVEIQGFVEWAHDVALFLYDKNRNEIVRARDTLAGFSGPAEPMIGV